MWKGIIDAKYCQVKHVEGFSAGLAVVEERRKTSALVVLGHMNFVFVYWALKLQNLNKKQYINESCYYL